MKTIAKSRFDTRLSKEQKEYFEFAAKLGGFRSLTDFIIHAAQNQATSIVEKHNAFLGSKKDRDIFFNALMNPPTPNTNLKKAMIRYKKTLEK
ncbi:type II toxin-antitoxin system TacA family antitoxin [Sediminibacterium sp. TEGAF015]|uniref:type II toxin-antitoxin system TacA family antitoxin n=1 Tax=Sediminibacterium sp. TEGAF015 TaxID=575378 RepID=UPI00220CAB97|nr:DUF1778 domain-containing protein [Sediminibacterium sp. TEGAF015]BDQ13305.1 hypothetical protein TEGAF0_25220 [Sediminibacterium sp. TEGAF015]